MPGMNSGLNVTNPIVVAAFHLGDRAIDRVAPRPPRSCRLADFEAWHAACEWVANYG